MNDLKKVVTIADFKVSVKHHFNSSKMVRNAPLFSEVNTYYSNTKKIGLPVKKQHTLNSLLERLNSIKTKPTKADSIAILKGLYKDGTNGVFCYEGAPFLFFDIDVKKDKNENIHLLDKFKNAAVFEQLKKLAVLVWRSNSGFGIAGVLYVPQLAEILNNDRAKHLSIGKEVTKYLKETLKVDADFDNAQSKFRQYRFLAMQTAPRTINANPYVFTYDVKEVAKKSQAGVAQFRYENNRAVIGSIADQFNSSTQIHNALLDNGLSWLNGTRYKHSSTTSASTGTTGGTNVFFNHSQSFSNYKVFTPFYLYLTLHYNNDLKKFLDVLKSRGYTERQPQQSALIKSESILKQQTANRTKQIFSACYDLRNLPYKKKLLFVNKNAKNDAEKIVFFDYLKIKPLTINYDKTLKIKDFVSEKLKEVLEYADEHKKIILTAETGTGKTTAFLKKFESHRPNKRIIILAPLTAIVEQNKDKNIVSLTANSEPREHTKAKTSFFVMATYEQGYKHLSTGNKFDYVVIDEVHNLITANRFKSEAIRRLTSVLHRYNIIGLTGTTNPLFRSVGYKLVNVKKEVLKPVDLLMRIDNRSTLKIALQHLKTIEGKCIMRLNSRDNLKAVRKELIKQKRYSKNEILIFNSDKSVKESRAFVQLTDQGYFDDEVKIVLTTSVIDEGLSISQKGFTDVVFIENKYHPTAESVKQFLARFRNEDTNRENYFYFRETKQQILNSWNPFFEFNKVKTEIIEDAKQRNVKESKNKDIANNDYLFYENGFVNNYALCYDVCTEFFKRLTTKEYINFLEINYNLNITVDTEYSDQSIDITELQKEKKCTKVLIGRCWINNIDEVLSALYRLTNNRSIKNSISYTGMNPTDEVYNLVFENIKEFERLHKKCIALEGLGVSDVNAELINLETFEPINSRVVNRKLNWLHTLETLENPITSTDKKNKNKIIGFISNVGKLDNFNTSTLISFWKKQRSNSVKYDTIILKDLVLKYHPFIENKKLKKWSKKVLD
jgi:hypothetical protein